MLLRLNAGIWLGKRHLGFVIANVNQYVTDTFDHVPTILCIVQDTAEARPKQFCNILVLCTN